MVQDKATTICLKQSTKEMLQPFKETYGTYEKAIIELIKDFEGEYFHKPNESSPQKSK